MHGNRCPEDKDAIGIIHLHDKGQFHCILPVCFPEPAGCGQIGSGYLPIFHPHLFWDPAKMGRNGTLQYRSPHQFTHIAHGNGMNTVNMIPDPPSVFHEDFSKARLKPGKNRPDGMEIRRLETDQPGKQVFPERKTIACIIYG